MGQRPHYGEKEKEETDSFKLHRVRNLRDKIAAYAEETGSKLIILEDGYTLEDILKRNTKALAITNKDLADAIIRSVEIKEKENG